MVCINMNTEMSKEENHLVQFKPISQVAEVDRNSEYDRHASCDSEVKPETRWSARS